MRKVKEEKRVFALDLAVSTGRGEVRPRYAFEVPPGLDGLIAEGRRFAFVGHDGEETPLRRFRTEEELLEAATEALKEAARGFGKEDLPYSFSVFLLVEGPDGEERLWELRARAAVTPIPVEVEAEGLALKGEIPWVPGRYIALGYAYRAPWTEGGTAFRTVAEDPEGRLRFREVLRDPREGVVWGHGLHSLEEAVRLVLVAARRFEGAEEERRRAAVQVLPRVKEGCHGGVLEAVERATARLEGLVVQYEKEPYGKLGVAVIPLERR